MQCLGTKATALDLRISTAERQQSGIKGSARCRTGMARGQRGTTWVCERWPRGLHGLRAARATGHVGCGDGPRGLRAVGVKGTWGSITGRDGEGRGTWLQR